MKVLASNERYTVSKPRNSWDMNYEVHDKEEGKTYLIDIDDVCSNEAEQEAYGGILYSSLLNIDMVEILGIYWKVKSTSF